MLRFAVSCVLLTACVDDPSLDEVQQDVDVCCPGMTTSGIQNLRGLTGTYRRVTLPVAGEPLRLTLFAEIDSAVDGSEAHGTFSGTVATETGLAELYAGRFGALADNPAIGAAMVLDVNGDREWDRAYFIIGSSRLLGQVQSLCLSGTERTFQLSRTLY